MSSDIFNKTDLNSSKIVDDFMVQYRKQNTKCWRPSKKSLFSDHLLRCQIPLSQNEAIDRNNLCQQISKLLKPQIKNKTYTNCFLDDNVLEINVVSF